MCVYKGEYFYVHTSEGAPTCELYLINQLIATEAMKIGGDEEYDGDFALGISDTDDFSCN